MSWEVAVQVVQLQSVLTDQLRLAPCVAQVVVAAVQRFLLAGRVVLAVVALVVVAAVQLVQLLAQVEPVEMAQ